MKRNVCNKSSDWPQQDWISGRAWTGCMGQRKTFNSSSTMALSTMIAFQYLKIPRMRLRHWITIRTFLTSIWDSLTSIKPICWDTLRTRSNLSPVSFLSWRLIFTITPLSIRTSRRGWLRSCWITIPIRYKWIHILLNSWVKILFLLNFGVLKAPRQFCSEKGKSGWVIS